MRINDPTAFIGVEEAEVIAQLLELNGRRVRELGYRAFHRARPIRPDQVGVRRRMTPAGVHFLKSHRADLMRKPARN